MLDCDFWYFPILFVFGCKEGVPDCESLFCAAGGTVVCVGGETTFHDVVFRNCSLVVLSGAHAALSTSTFCHHTLDVEAQDVGSSVIVHGQNSKIVLSGGSITGVMKGISVEAGASLEAVDLTISDIVLTGVEVKDEGSSLQLNSCNMHKFNGRTRAEVMSRGVHLHNQSTAYIGTSTISCEGAHRGIDICTQASATLAHCTILQYYMWGLYSSGRRYVSFTEGATGSLQGCTYSHGEEVQACLWKGGGVMFMSGTATAPLKHRETK